MEITARTWKEWKIISIDGTFVVKNLMRIRKVFDEVEKRAGPLIALDLTKTSHIDSSAITLMLNFQRRVLSNNGKLVVFGPNEDIMGIFSIVGFDNAIPVYRSRTDFETSFAL